MTIQNISFGKKIPIAKCSIKNRLTRKYVPATCYEIDCKDEADYLEIANLKKKWYFKNSISNDIERKHNNLNDGFGLYLNRHFYTMQTDSDNQIVGICQTEEINKDLELIHLETSPNKKYKYAGQGLLAVLSIIAGKDKTDNIYIPFPVDSARAFYTDKCGFKNCQSNDGLYMNKKRFGLFRQQVEKRMQAPILDINI